MIRCFRAFLAFAAVLTFASTGSCATGKPVFSATFDDKVAWTPLPGMTTEVVTLSDRGKCLHLHGRQESGWNYARADAFKLEAGHKYRVVGWVRVAKASPALPPYFKVECTGGVSAQFATDRYDLAAGGWQKLVGEFECPKGNAGGWIALEKGVNTPVELDADVDEVSVMEIDRFTAEDKYRFDTMPAPLAQLQGVHPRLYLTAERIATLKSRVGNEPYASLLTQLTKVADELASDGPPAYIKEDRHSGEEQLYQREVGNAIPNLALTYVLTGERRYLEAARAWMLASAGYPTWGLGAIDGMDLATGHQLYGLALGYDWLYPDLDAKTRETVRACLQRRGQHMYQGLLSGQAWWHNAYLQNHQWVDMTGLAAAGLALLGEVEGVDGWILLPLEKLQTTMASLGPDGASHEGVPYWTYGLEYLLKLMDLTNSLLEKDLFASNAWFEHTASFRLYSMLPRRSWTRESDLMTFADGPRYDWYGPDYMLRKLAAEYRDGHAQWLANELRSADLCNNSAAFLNLLWVDPSVAPQLPADLPTFKRFDDLDIVFMRSSWDGDEAVMAFKCGPFIGHHALAKYSYDPGGGHVHPDAGAFQLFAHGDWLIVDDEYTWKTTAFQNTALVNGIGQEGEGEAWFGGERLCVEKRGAKILRADHGQEYDYVIGDATEAYKREAGLTKFLRHILYLRPDCWVIVDELEAASPSTFELYFHADFPFKQQDDRTFSVRGKSGALLLTTLAPENLVTQSWRQPLVGTSGKPAGEIEALKLSNRERGKQAVFVTLLESYPAASAPRVKPTITDKNGQKILTLAAPEGTRRFVLRTGRTDPASPVLGDLGNVEP
jgi:hypothetical protein